MKPLLFAKGCQKSIENINTFFRITKTRVGFVKSNETVPVKRVFVVVVLFANQIYPLGNGLKQIKTCGLFGPARGSKPLLVIKVLKYYREPQR